MLARPYQRLQSDRGLRLYHAWVSAKNNLLATEKFEGKKCTVHEWSISDICGVHGCSNRRTIRYTSLVRVTQNYVLVSYLIHYNATGLILRVASYTRRILVIKYSLE